MPLFCFLFFEKAIKGGCGGGGGGLRLAAVTNALFPAPLIHIHAWDACCSAVASPRTLESCSNQASSSAQRRLVLFGKIALF